MPIKITIESAFRRYWDLLFAMRRSDLMPRKLRNFKDMTPEERKRISSMGGKRSGEARRERRLFKDEIAKRLGADDFNEIIDNLIARSKNSDKAFEVLRDTLGEKPVEEVSVTTDTITVEINE